MEALTIFEGLEAIYRAGAAKSREWPYNNQAQVQSEVLSAMADEAHRQTVRLLSRHD